MTVQPADSATIPARRAALPFPVAFAALIVAATAMGVSPVFVRYAEIGPFASAFWRVAVALPVLLLWAWWEARAAGEHFSVRFPVPVLLAGLFFAGDLTFWHLAILNTTMANATLMSCLAPVWVLFLSGFFIGEKTPPLAFAGLVVCVVGAVVLIGDSFRVEPERLMGDFYGLVTSFFFGLYFLAIRVCRRTMGGAAVTLSSSLVTASALFIIAWISGNSFSPTTLTGLGALICLGLLSHAGGQGLLTVALGSLSASFSSLVIFLEAAAAALFGWLVFSEYMTPFQGAGAMLILLGVWIARPRIASIPAIDTTWGLGQKTPDAGND